LKSLLIDGEPTDLFVQVVGDTVDLGITGPIGRNGKPDAAVGKTLTKLAEVANLARVTWRESARGKPERLVARQLVTATFGTLKVRFPSFAFLQPTVEGEQALVSAVMEALPAKGPYADLFSGCGTFSGAMLERGPVDAYEMLPHTVQALAKAGER